MFGDVMVSADVSFPSLPFSALSLQVSFIRV